MILEIDRFVWESSSKISKKNRVIFETIPEHMVYLVYCMVREFPKDFIEICKKVDEKIYSASEDNEIDIGIDDRESLLYDLLRRFYNKYQG